MRSSHRVALACALSLCALTACAAPEIPKSPAHPRPAVPQSLVTTLTPRDGVPYYRSGVYAASDTSVAVGILRYRSVSATQGAWILASRETTTGYAVLAADVQPFAILLGVRGFDAKLGHLDGQYVAAEGSAAPARSGVTSVSARAVSLVSDMFPTATSKFTKPGLYTRPDGSQVALGWTGKTVAGVTTLYDRPPEGTATAIPIVQVTRAWSPGDTKTPVMEAEGHVIGKGAIPLLKPFRYGVSYMRDFSGELRIGMPVSLLGVECAGIKDRPNGRTRVVGELDRDPRGPRADRLGLSVPAAPWGISMIGERAHVVLDDPNGLVPAALRYGIFAAEGKLTPDGYIHRLEVEKFEAVPQP
jgi:hypothetical protein